mmetsp:Transcript_1576/g.3443  ORF Transcript_1576/g.3443 Transcript_1576/m.3443 type:complete len:445 (+) Transcript_1576:207-1541(+)|eukprot:CAMPEP_0206421136 /NCGR_PEP_ID=MMETSP0324_2-20121206/1271_1 /ASSEMBLY_ACC=CAM_ASM_000836 /TAXON_ID=2866 /ORGANISM="Crypthecodinium cohnii, Strain Seligo" /LENGTH=444 /DNA_ID=CAMNT_0053885179 /DNA_START=148 /DNA_END=1482 /DNA_ORIENTATION=-
MGKKGAKKDPNAPTPVPEDSFIRAKRLQELKITPKQPKGEFTSEEWCIPPAFHSQPEFKTVIHFWKQCATVAYAEREMKVPSRAKFVDDDSKTEKRPHPRKEIQDLFKYMKAQNKQAAKRTKQFLKQLVKKEKKEQKREKLLQQIHDADTQMNEELRAARRFVDRQELFDKRYMIGTKLGTAAPRKNALIVIEVSDKQQAWIDETKDEVNKLLNLVINEGECETFNIATFSGNAVTTWCPQFQAKTDPKKGLADSIKWLNKNFSAKTCSAQAYPPDWPAMLQKFTAEGQQVPWRIFLCCSRPPERMHADVVNLVKDLRTNLGEPAKGQPPLPLNIVAFDPTIVNDQDELGFFQEVAGPDGSFMVDTSAEDLQALDKMLKAVAVKKKQLDKFHKKLDKMEDLSERVQEDRSLLQMQMALQAMLANDLEILDWALKNEVEPPPPEI